MKKNSPISSGGVTINTAGKGNRKFSPNSNSGIINIYTGDTEGGDSGSIFINSGTSNSGKTGNIILSTSNSPMGEAGSLKFTGGNSTHMNGQVYIYLAAPLTPNHQWLEASVYAQVHQMRKMESSGSLRLETSSSPSSSTVTIRSGAASTKSGEIEISSGAVESGKSGNVMLNVGSSHSGDGGNINLEAGQSSGLGGSILLYSGGGRKNLEVYQFSPN